MNQQTAIELTKEIQEIADKHSLITGRSVRIFTENDCNKSWEVKVFERNSDDTISGGILSIVEYSRLATKYETNCMVRVEWKDGKGTKDKPYFLFF